MVDQNSSSHVRPVEEVEAELHKEHTERIVAEEQYRAQISQMTGDMDVMQSRLVEMQGREEETLHRAQEQMEDRENMRKQIGGSITPTYRPT